MTADVIVPFHGKTGLLTRCLKALFFPSSLEGSVYLVDDGSSKADAFAARRLADLLPLPVRWLSLPVKSGFVAAVNHAWRKCSKNIVIILNNDTVPPPCLLPRLTTALESFSRLAAVAPASDNRADLFQYRPPPYHLYNNTASVCTDHIVAAPYLTAMCLAVRRSAVTGKALFDPSYSPGYFEDLDLCCRLRARRWTLAIDEGCLIHHEGRSTFGSEPHLHALLERNYTSFASHWAHLPEHGALHSMLQSV